MPTWQRIGIASAWTVALLLLGIIYNRVFVESLLPLVDTDGTFSTPVVWADNVIPIVIVALVIAAWVWVIAGAVQEERTVDRRRVRR